MKQHLRAIIFCGLMAVTTSFGLGGCKQTEGDRCQLDSDCEDGLICCYLTGQSVKEGICLPRTKCDLEPDSGPSEDGGQDSAADDSAPEDAAEPDTLQPDTLQPDTLQPDTLQPDTLQPDTLQPDMVTPGDAASVG